MQPIAVISDIHGNLEALEAVLAEIDRLGVKRIYSLGDTVGYGPEPEACVRISREKFTHRLMGNHEYAVVHTNVSFLSNRFAAEALEWTRKRVREAGMVEELEALMPQHQEDEILFVHGSVRGPLEEYVTERDRSGYSAFDEIIETIEKDFTTFRLCFVGHNHKPFLATTEGFLHPHAGLREFHLTDEKLYVSVGSVGQPRDGDPRSCFVVYDGERVTYHRIAYPWEVTAAKIRACGLPGYLADRLGKGL